MTTIEKFDRYDSAPSEFYLSPKEQLGEPWLERITIIHTKNRRYTARVEFQCDVYDESESLSTFERAESFDEEEKAVQWALEELDRKLTMLTFESLEVAFASLAQAVEMSAELVRSTRMSEAEEIASMIRERIYDHAANEHRVRNDGWNSLDLIAIYSARNDEASKIVSAIMDRHAGSST
jgi:hypothetical protein